MNACNYFELMFLLCQIANVTDNTIRIHHTKYDSAKYYEFEILDVSHISSTVKMLVDGKPFNVTFAEIKEMKFDVEEYSLLNGFFHTLIDKHEL